VKTLAWPEVVEVAPGTTGVFSVAITNTSQVIDAYHVQVFGLDPSWVQIEPARLSLFPGDTENVSVNLRLPEEYPASRRTLAVNVVSDDDPASFSLSQVELAVQTRTHTSVKVDPSMVQAGRRATFGMVVGNVGNSAVTASAYAVDPEELAQFTFEPPQVVVAPGREQVVQVTAEGGRAWFGPPRPRTFTLGVDAETRVESLATFVQRPRIGRWMLMLLGLLTAAAVFAMVLSRSFERVVDEARVSSAVVDAALSSGEAGGAMIPANPGSITGKLLSSTTNQGLAGAQAELYVATDTAMPVASAATDDSGSFVFSNLGEGTYLLRISGSGVNVVWYGNTATPTGSTPIEVVVGDSPADPVELAPIIVGGIPVPVSGAVAIDDPSGVTISLITTSQVVDGDAVVASVQPGPDGSFVLDGVPSPGAYTMVVEKEGFATERRPILLEPGQPLNGVEVTLRPGNGIITGLVSGPDGPLGGATIVATDGSTEISTVSLTVGDTGTYTLRNLATPGQYTVTISLDGYASESRAISLSPDVISGTFSAQLLPATGSIQGQALLDGAPARGLTVTLSGGAVNRTTAVLSQGDTPGGYAFFGLPAPGTYTLTFAGDGTIPQVQVVDLDPASGNAVRTGVNVNLSRETTTIRGLVYDPPTVANPTPLLAARATVTLSNGTDDYTFLTADDPLGAFEFSNVPPGAYTLRASRVGTQEVVKLINVSASSPAPPQELFLGPQASISGLVTGFDPALRQVTVRLFTPELFPIRTASTPTTQTDATGRYVFTALEAPTSYVIAIYANATETFPLDSEVVSTQPGEVSPAPTINVVLP
jgi:hypothetical protein